MGYLISAIVFFLFAYSKDHPSSLGFIVFPLTIIGELILLLIPILFITIIFTYIKWFIKDSYEN